MAYQRAYLPMKVITLSQGYGSSSGTHKLSYALDLSGSDRGKDPVFAPFDCKVTKLYQPSDIVHHATTVWLTSTQKVLCRNGYYGYLTMSITHPREILNMKLGTIYKQGVQICTEGDTGNASGPHIHLELAKGTTAGWTLQKSGNYQEYVIINKVKPEEYLFAYDDAIIKEDTYKGKKYQFVKEKDITYKVTGVPSEPLMIHTEANFSKNTILDSKGLCNGDEVIKFYEKNGMSYIYNYSRLGYTSSAYLVKI